MDSPVSHESHNTFKTYNKQQVHTLMVYIDKLVKLSHEQPPMYTLKTFIKHAKINKAALVKASESTAVEVPASILFWIYRASVHLRTPPPFHLPHICKLRIEGTESFFITTKEDWVNHRKSITPVDDSHSVALSDHATLKFLTRVLKIDLQPYLDKIPHKRLLGEGTRLEDGRIAIEIDGFNYIMDRRMCVTILDKGMLLT